MKDECQAATLMRFFKTGKGQYGEGDSFLGLKVPQTRMVVNAARLDVDLTDIGKLLYSQWHEARLAGFLLLVEEMKAALPSKRKKQDDGAERRDEIAAFYLRHARQANNWDLVDLSCPKILGEWLLHPSSDGMLPDRSILDSLVASDNLWERRIGIVTTWRLVKERQTRPDSQSNRMDAPRSRKERYRRSDRLPRSALPRNAPHCPPLCH